MDSTNQSSRENILYDQFINIVNRIHYFGYMEMGGFVLNNLCELLSLALNKKSKALQIVTNSEFLIAMDINSIPLAQEDINKFNCLYRAYMINPEKNVIYNSTSAILLYKIVSRLNQPLIQTIKELKIDEKDAVWLVVNRYSSTDERRNIRRMVRVMQHMNPIIMTEQMVVDIFSKTFNQQFTNLFIAVMTDRFDSFDDADEKYVYSTISNALLDILNTLEINDIKKIIIAYETELKNTKSNGRFSLHTVNSGDYRKICDAVDEIEEEGYTVK